MWGRTVFAVVAVALVSGCSSDEADDGAAGNGGGSGGAGPDGGTDAALDTEAPDADNDVEIEPDAQPAWPPAAPAPPVGEPISGLTFHVGWQNPRKLPEPISTVGWEDSAFISADGTTLLFAYSPLNFYEFNQGNGVIDGPDRPGQTGYAFDIYEGTIENGLWQVVNSSVNHPDPAMQEAALGVNRTIDRMAFIRFEPEGNIFLSDRNGGSWTTPVMLPPPVNTPCIEDNAHLSPDGLRLYFDSNREDPEGASCGAEKDRGIFVTTYANGQWTVPQRIEGAPEETSGPWQAFTTDDEQTLYWSAEGTDCDAVVCIYRAAKQLDGTFDGLELVAEPTRPELVGPEDVFALGEISITADGEYFYFVYVVASAVDYWDVSIGVAEAIH